MKDLGRVSLFWEEVWSRWVRDERRVGAHRARGFAGDARVSVRGAGAHRLVESEDGSDGGNLVQRADEPHLRRARVGEGHLHAPLRERAEERLSSRRGGVFAGRGARGRGRDGRGGHLLPMVRRCGRSARVGMRRSVPRARPEAGTFTSRRVARRDASPPLRVVDHETKLATFARPPRRRPLSRATARW